MTSIIIIIITIAKILPTCFNISLSCFYIVVVPLHQIFRVVPDLTGHIIITIATILPTCFTILSSSSYSFYITLPASSKTLMPNLTHCTLPHCFTITSSPVSSFYITLPTSTDLSE